MTAGSPLIPWECRGPTLLFLPPCSSPHRAVTIASHPGTWGSVDFGLCCSPALQKHSRTRGYCTREPSTPIGSPVPPSCHLPVPPHLVDVLHALHRELGEPGHVELPAAVGAQLDLQLLLWLLPQQVPAPRGTHHPPRPGADTGLRAGGGCCTPWLQSSALRLPPSPDLSPSPAPQRLSQSLSPRRMRLAPPACGWAGEESISHASSS